jgi:molecular chaperone DnaJ
MPGGQADHYTVLGVQRSASAGELRRAFRVLALRHHPDRAGPDATTLFQAIAEAYAVLSDPILRASYDARLRAREGAPQAPSRAAAAAARHHRSAPAGYETGEYQGPGGRIGWRRRKVEQPAEHEVIARLSGALDDLLARGLARRLANGLLEVELAVDEAREGGTIAIDAVVKAVCPTCSGLAERGVLWCRRCEHEGTIVESVTFAVDVPAGVNDRTTFSFAAGASDAPSGLRVRVRAA